MDVLEYIKKYTTFRPPPYHEAIFKILEEASEKDKNLPLVDINNRGRWYKDLRLTEFSYSHLTKMTKGQTFAVATLEGIHIFKKIEFQSYQNESNITKKHDK